jgi:hypothetical protein
MGTARKLQTEDVGQSTSPAKTEFKLKRPVMVYIFGGLFMLAPFGNLLITGIFNYPTELLMRASTWTNLLSRIQWMPATLLCLEFFAGAALFIQRKSTWMFAMAVLGCIVAYDLAVVIPSGVYPTYITATVTSASIAFCAILFHFRFPYLDRRDHVSGMAYRHVLETPVRITGSSQPATVLNMSRKGMKLDFSGWGKIPQLGEILVVELSQPVSARVVRIEGQNCGLEFNQLNRAQKAAIKDFINHFKK